MGIIDTRVFKSGNSMAVRLPKEFGFLEGMAVRIERTGDGVTIRPAVDPIAEKRKVTELVETLREIWKDAPPDADRGRREPIEFPDRPGLY